MTKLLHPQEIETFFIIPALRKEIAVRLKGMGLEQKKIAKILIITEAAVSNYIKSKRANMIHFEKDVEKKIDEACERLKKDGNIVKEIQILLKYIERKGYRCKIHKKYGTTIKDCKECDF